MNNFTYNNPDERKYHTAIISYLQKKLEQSLLNKIKNARCAIHSTSDYSRKRWNALYTTVIFYVSITDFEEFSQDEKDKLINICDLLMPPEVGFDVRDVQIAIDIENNPDEEKSSLENDLKQIHERLQQEEAKFTLPEEMLNMGEEMSKSYLYLYVVENYLRLFVQNIAIRHFGKDYFSKLNISSPLMQKIETRQAEEKKHQWLSIRGSSILFYLDFKEIGIIIKNNWEIFKNYFPDQAWITSKIDEMGSCRNKIAHNSFLDLHEQQVIKTNFNSIVRQINIQNT